MGPRYLRVMLYSYQGLDVARIIRIAGGGPAGCAAALAALREGADVELYEKARFPRHKVCGEFLSGEAARVLDALGVSIDGLHPARIERVELCVGRVARTARLPQHAYGISRHALDAFLLSQVPDVRHQTALTADIIATGRPATSTSDRLFGFKAHFAGPAADTIGLYFFGRTYVGVNSIEGGLTNVCGVAPQAVLRQFGHDFDALIRSYQPLAERIEPLSRAWKWIGAGPLAFTRHRDGLRCGDALAFIDPFTGSGMLHALYTGRLAGIAAARGTPVEWYQEQVRLSRPFAAASVIRAALANHLDALAAIVPVSLLYRMTRIHA